MYFSYGLKSQRKRRGISNNMSGSALGNHPSGYPVQADTTTLSNNTNSFLRMVRAL